MVICARVRRFDLLQTLRLAALCLCVGNCGAHAAHDVSIHADRQGSAVVIDARATLSAPAALIWETLTDYDGLAAFIPGMRASRVLERRAGSIIVKQQGEAGFLFFTHAIDVVVEAREQPPREVSVRVLSGNLRQLEGRYRIESDPHRSGHVVLRWSGLIEPESGLPPLIGVPILRSNIGAQFRGLIREIERREAAEAKKNK
jgi:ribosome-associated toxin RatA of RatAB toxin-antitoxin module